MLYLVEGYDHQEISEILNISEVASQARSYLRGKQKLQNSLKIEKKWHEILEIYSKEDNNKNRVQVKMSEGHEARFLDKA